MAKLLQDAAATKKRLRQATEDNDRSSGIKFNATNNEIVENDNKIKSKKVKQTNEKVIKEVTDNVIYLGHLPHGFEEKEMKLFFKQFGDIKRVKLFRNKKTLRSRGYAFIEFIDSEIAKVVSEAMNGYMMHEKVLICNIVTKDKIHDGMFKGPKRITNKEIIASENTTETIKTVV